jgi:transcriptional regulator with XRE-family HTH domain
MERTEIGTYLEMLRLKKGLSQRELAKLAGVSHTEISRIESGEREKPSAKNLAKLSTPLGISNEKLLAVAGYIQRNEVMAAHDPGGYYGITPEIQAVIKEEVEKAWAEAEAKNKKKK